MELKYYKTILPIFLSFFIINSTSAQYRSLDFGLSSSAMLDDYRDAEYEYDAVAGGVIGHVTLGYTFSINNKMSFSPRIAYSYSLVEFRKGGAQLSQFPNMLPSIDSITVRKSQTYNFIKIGIAYSYWIDKVGKGIYLESELQNLFFVSAKSENFKQIGTEEPQLSTVDIKDDVRVSVPTLRVGVGYNLPIKNINLFIRAGAELRLSTYFKSTDNNTFIDRTIGFGFRYVFQNKIDEL